MRWFTVNGQAPLYWQWGPLSPHVACFSLPHVLTHLWAPTGTVLGSCGTKPPCVFSVAGCRRLLRLLAESCARSCHPPANSWQPKPRASGFTFRLHLLVVGFLFLLNAGKYWLDLSKGLVSPSQTKPFLHRRQKPHNPKIWPHVWVCSMHMRWIYCSAGRKATPSGSVICLVTRVFS